MLPTLQTANKNQYSKPVISSESQTPHAVSECVREISAFGGGKGAELAYKMRATTAVGEGRGVVCLGFFVHTGIPYTLFSILRIQLFI
jgi:hypothetical protein